MAARQFQVHDTGDKSMHKKIALPIFASLAIMVASQAPASAATAVSKPALAGLNAASDLIQLHSERGIAGNWQTGPFNLYRGNRRVTADDVVINRKRKKIFPSRN
jgi:hypothetical protein